MSGDVSDDGASPASVTADRADVPEGNLDAQYGCIDVGGSAAESAASRPLVPDGLLAELPFPLPHWEDFERLVVALARDVDDLVEVRRYGTSGQAQFGIDVIGFTRRERQPQAYQGKNVSRFGESDLAAAVGKFTGGRRPFGAKRLVLTVAVPVKDNLTLERLDAANAANPDLVIELWDSVRINELLRTRPDIVRVFFGEQAVHRFCLLADVSRAKPVVAGDIPGRLPAFQSRDTIITPLHDQGSRSDGCLIHVVSGMRGVGKTQAAGAYARQRIADKWRLIAWVHAESGAAILDGLSQAAARLGISAPGDDQADTARALRHWLEADGEQCLVVFDNAAGPGGLRPYLPTTGGAQVIVTSTHQAVARMGTDIRADVFTESEALAYLAARTGLPGGERARDLAAELGRLPLALAQAAAVINAQRLSYQTYLDRLRAFPVAGYLSRPAEDPYPLPVAAAILLSRLAVQESDVTGMAAQVMDLVSLLSAGGVSRDLLYAAALAGHLTPGEPLAVGLHGPSELSSAAQVDAALACLADASVLTFSDDGSTVSSHGLTRRVIREQHVRDGTFPAAAAAAIASLDAAMSAAEPYWRHPATARNLIQQVIALTSHFAVFTGGGDDQNAENLLELRLSALFWLAELADDYAEAARLGEDLVTDCERVLGRDHPHTLAARSILGAVYGDTERLEDAIRLGRETLADCERVLGRDDTTTLAARMNLAMHYKQAQRLDDAAGLAEQALAETERVLGPNDMLTMVTRDIVADTMLQKGQAAAAIALSERNLADAERALDPGHPGITRFRNNLANAFAEAGRQEKAITLHEQILAQRLQAFGPDHPVTLRSRHNVANAYWLAGETTEAIARFEALIADRERLLGPDHHDTLLTRAMLAGAKVEAGHLEQAIVLSEQALAGQTRVLGGSHPATFASRNNLATAYMRVDRVDEAIALFEPTASHLERESGPGHPDTLTTQHNLACAYLEAGRLKDAIVLNKSALASAARFLGSDHLDTIKLRAGLAEAYRRAERFDRAIPLYEQALDDRERVLGPDHPDTVASRNSLAATYLQAGRGQEASVLLENVLRAWGRVLGSGHPDMLTARSRLAEAYRQAGKPERAVRLLKRVQADQERVLGPDHPDTVSTRGHLAAACLAAGRLEVATGLLERARDDLERVLGPDDLQTLTAQANLALAHWRAGKLKAAAELYQRTLAHCEQALGHDHSVTRTVRQSLADLREMPV